MLPIKDNIPTDRLPIVTLLLIAANVGVYCFAQDVEIAHGGLAQLLVDALFLWIFGANVEDAMSRPRFLAFFLLGGAVAIGTLVLLDPGSPVAAAGVSGAIAAVVGGYVLLYPRARFMGIMPVILSFTLIEVPAWALLAAWFVAQAIFAATSLGDAGGGGVAFVAQLGGFAFGLVAIRLFAQRRKGLPSAPGVPVWG